MNLERLRWGEWIAAIAALDLLLVTFRGWYSISGGGGHVTAWDALSQGRYLLIATAVVGIFLWLLQASEDSTRLSFAPGWIAAAVGAACTAYIVYRLVSPPQDNYDPALGLYLGLASAAGVAIGGLLSAREAAPAATGRTASEVAADTFSGPTGPREEPLGELVPDSGGTWSGSAPAAASSTGWSPAAPGAAAAGAAGAGAAATERPLQPGDHVTLTTGGARFPAGTVAEVVEVFRGGALVEVKAADGMAERFEVPEAAFERTGAQARGGLAAPPTEATSPSTEGADWSPAMPAAATGDWGFDDEPGAAEAEEPQTEKVPWWKREIGGGKKKAGAAAATAAVASAAGIVAADKADDAEQNGNGNGNGEAKPSFFKRIFGGGGKAPANDETTEVPEAEPTPAVATAGMGEAAESDTAVHETAPESVVDDAPAAVGASALADHETERTPDEPEAAAEASPVEDEAAATTPEPVAAPPEPEPEAVAPEAAPAAPAPVAAEDAAAPEPAVTPAEPEPAPEAEAAAAEPVVTPSEPEPEAAAPEPVVTPTEPEAAAADPDTPGAVAEPEAEAPKRRRSSGSRKVPKEVLVTSDAPQPKVGDEVQLKVGGGKFDAGTRGTVVDVFSSGVIVELSAPDGRSERLDLPFEAVAPADA